MRIEARTLAWALLGWTLMGPVGCGDEFDGTSSDEILQVGEQQQGLGGPLILPRRTKSCAVVAFGPPDGFLKSSAEIALDFFEHQLGVDEVYTHKSGGSLDSASFGELAALFDAARRAG